MNFVLQRLNQVASKCFGSRPNLARAINKKPQTLNGYYQKDSIPGGEFLASLRELGISSDWLLSGEGSMFASNEAGRALRAKASGTDAANATKLLQQPILTGAQTSPPALIPMQMSEEDENFLRGNAEEEQFTDEDITMLHQLTKKITFAVEARRRPAASVR
jgi:hypothetical protein